jgi:hypothetical protein
VYNTMYHMAAKGMLFSQQFASSVPWIKLNGC